MYRKSKPGPRRKADVESGTTASKMVTFRLYAEDLERLDALIAAGYATNRTEVVRRSIAETARWTLPRE